MCVAGMIWADRSKRVVSFMMLTVFFVAMVGVMLALQAVSRNAVHSVAGCQLGVQGGSRFKVVQDLGGTLTYRVRGIDGKSGAVLDAMTLGNKSGLTKELRSQYSRSGVSHILALSGYHLTLIYVLLELVLMSKIISLKWRWISNVIILGCIWAFALIAGLPPSLVRATIMCSIMIVSKIFCRNALSFNSLAIAAMVMLLINPLQIYDVGFELSFVSMIGILGIGIPICRWMSAKVEHFHWAWLWDKCLSVIIITLTCTIFTAPLVAFYFHQLPLLSIIPNLCLSIVVPIVMCGAVVWWILWPFPMLQNLITPVVEGGVDVMNGITEYTASLPWVCIEWRPDLTAIILFYIGLWSIIKIFRYICKSKVFD